MLKKFLALSAFIFLPIFGFCEVINVFHTSDVHGFYFPRNIEGKNIGGYATLANYLAQQKTPYLLLDSGDFTSGTAEAKSTKGALSVQFMNKLNYNAITIGNHENDFKEEAMLKNIESMEADVLAANMYDNQLKSLPKNVKAFKVYMVNGKKIAVIGIAKDPNPNSKRIKTSGDRKAVKKALYEVQKQNPDATILIIHNSVADDKHESSKSPAQIVKGLEGINLVLGGHAHKIVQNKVIDGVVFVESGTELRAVSKIALDFNDKTGKLENIKSELIEMDTDKIGQEPYIKEFAEANRNKELDTAISNANEKIAKENPNKRKAIDSPLGNLFADIIKQQTGAEIAMQNTGGVRVDMAKGPVNKRLVFEIFPFPNKIMILKVNGNFIRKMILKTLKEQNSLFQYAGLNIKYKYKNNRPEIVEITVNGKPLEKDRLYTLAVNDYIAEGNSEGYMFKKVLDKKLFSNKAISDMFIEYLEANPQGINAPQTGRIKKVD